MGGRIYDPELGRFMTADPIVQAPLFSQSYNRYAYVLNNPLRFVDPSGFLPCTPGFCQSMVNFFNTGERYFESGSLRNSEHDWWQGEFRTGREMSRDTRWLSMTEKQNRDAATMAHGGFLLRWARIIRTDPKLDAKRAKVWLAANTTTEVIGGKTVRVRGATADERFYVRMYAIATLGVTPRGQVIRNKLEGDPRELTISIGRNPNYPGSYWHGPTHTLTLDPNDLNTTYTSFGEQFHYDYVRIMAHELGHAYGTGDTPEPPGDQMDNVWENEWPITRDLGDPHPRTKY